MDFIFITSIKFFFLICSIAFINVSYTFAKTRPIIGILAQERGCKLSDFSQYNSYIAASYVKYLESAGARVVPIMIGQKNAYYEELLSHINGVLFPGGSSLFNETKGYAEAGKIIYDIAKKLNDGKDYFPIWGTCLGFELLTYLAANGRRHRKSCSCEREALTLEFTPNFRQSRMFKTAPDNIIDILKNEKVTANFHQTCITDKALETVNLQDDFRIISHSKAKDGTKFISSLEHVKYPFYGIQFHPEKNAAEWRKDLNIPHTANAIKITHFFADFFVNEARKNEHSYSTQQEVQRNIIYNWSPEYTELRGSVFEQCYMFPKRRIA